MKSPETLDKMTNEFLAVPPTNPQRKLKLGADLDLERKEVVDRLLDGALKMSKVDMEQVPWEFAELRDYWAKLYTVMKRMEDALKVEDDGEFRNFAARAIFRAE